MLDKRCKILLNIINKECVNSGYKVLEINDLALSMPSELGVDNEGITECINTLAMQEYISVKYQDDKEVCLSPLSKGRLIFENRIDQEIEKKIYQRKYFLNSFFGSMVGGLIVGVIFLLLVLLGGR